MKRQQKPPGKPGSIRLSLLMALLSLVFGLLLTAGLAVYLERGERAAAQFELDVRTDELAAGLERRVEFNAEILRGVAGLFAASEEITAREFRAYVAQLELKQYFRGIQAIGYVETFAGKQREHALSSIIRRRGERFAITPAGERERHAPVVFVEPEDWRNRRALGFDMVGEPVRYRAAMLAVERNAAILSDRVKLKQEVGREIQSGAVLFLPVYRPDLPLDDVAQRQAALKGWVYTALRIGDLLSNYLRDEYPVLLQRLHFRMYAGVEPTATALMFDSRPDATDADGVALLTVRRLDLLGQTWTLTAAATTPDDLAEPLTRTSRIVAVAGGALSLLLALITLVFWVGRQRVDAALDKVQNSNRQLADSESLIHGIYDTSGVGILLMDAQADIRHCNATMSQLFALPVEAIVGRNYYTLMPPEEVAATRERLAALADNRLSRIGIDRRYRRSDQSIFWAHTEAQALRRDDGEFIGIVVVVQDIGERLRMEQEIRAHRDNLEQLVQARTAEVHASEEKYRALVEQSLVGVFIFQEAALVYANAALAAIYGYATGAELCAARDFAELIEPVHRDAVMHRLQQLAERPDQSASFGSIGTGRDGQPVDLEIHARSLEYQGRPAIIGMLLDVTERKRAEEKQLLALAAAEHLSRLKTEFLNKVSHELRTPLNGILGFAQIGLRGATPEKAGQLFGNIVVSGERLLSIVRQMLDFSDLQQGRLTIQAQPCLLAEVLDRVVVTPRAQALAKGLDFGEERRLDFARGVIDGDRLAQIIDILLSNAVKFTERGSVSLQVEARAGELHLSVGDTGIGIPAERLPQLFKPFEQVDGSSTRRFGGAGLGLAICHQLVSNMGGRISVESEVDRGTRIAVSIPCPEDASAS